MELVNEVIDVSTDENAHNQPHGRHPGAALVISVFGGGTAIDFLGKSSAPKS